MLTVYEIAEIVQEELGNNLTDTEIERLDLDVVEDAQGDIYLLDHNNVLGTDEQLTQRVSELLEVQGLTTETYSPGKILIY